MSRQPKSHDLLNLAALPYAGAFKFLRHYDPLWQAETGEIRAWEVECDHRDDDEPRVFVVDAVTAAEALELGGKINPDYPFAFGVRPLGSNGRFAGEDEL